MAAELQYYYVKQAQPEEEELPEMSNEYLET